MSEPGQRTVEEAIADLPNWGDHELKLTWAICFSKRGHPWVAAGWNADEVRQLEAALLAEKTRRGL